MSSNDEDLRLLLAARARRAPTIDLGSMVDAAMTAPRDGWPARIVRAAAAVRDSVGAVAVVGLVVTALVLGGWLRFGAGAAPLPAGLWQSDDPVGSGAVGSETCVAIDLTDEAYSSGVVTLWWWQVGSDGCRSSTSGPMEATATMSQVRLPSAGLSKERPGYLVTLDLALLPSGTETVEFLLDPLRVSPTTSQLAAYSGGDAGGRVLSFTPVATLDVELPGGVPAPTPGQ